MTDRTRPAVMVGVAATAAAVALLPTAAAEPTTSYPTDDRGYVNTAAHCDDGQTLVEFGRTERALVAICIGPDAQMEYRGVRLSDQAGLTMDATRSADGTITATNDGVSYVLTPQVLLVSESDTVLYRDPWVEFHQPSFSSASATTTSTAPSSTAPSSTAPSSTAPSTTNAAPPPPTVSTTTVTLTPTESPTSTGSG